ncbi:MAG TPA: hypothetical protein VLE89_07500 [Chlamydiales bacterium]|nr:hypothetical protein [Chlamydiales bacterium]
MAVPAAGQRSPEATAAQQTVALLREKNLVIPLHRLGKPSSDRVQRYRHLEIDHVGVTEFLPSGPLQLLKYAGYGLAKTIAGVCQLAHCAIYTATCCYGCNNCGNLKDNHPELTIRLGYPVDPAENICSWCWSDPPGMNAPGVPMPVPDRLVASAVHHYRANQDDADEPD